MLKLKLEQEVSTMTLEDLMKIIPESEANVEYLADKFIKRVNENQYPIIEMRDKIARRIMDERTNMMHIIGIQSEKPLRKNWKTLNVNGTMKRNCVKRN